MSIRTLSSEEPYPGVFISLVEITDSDPEDGLDRRQVYEVYCDVCDSFDAGLNRDEAQAVLAEHHHHIEKGRE